MKDSAFHIKFSCENIMSQINTSNKGIFNKHLNAVNPVDYYANIGKMQSAAEPFSYMHQEYTLTKTIITLNDFKSLTSNSITSTTTKIIGKYTTLKYSY